MTASAAPWDAGRHTGMGSRPVAYEAARRPTSKRCQAWSGGQWLVYLHGQSPFANLSGVFFALAHGERKNDDWRFEFGLEQHLYNPLNPTTLNFGKGLEAGNTRFIRGHTSRSPSKTPSVSR